MEINVMEINFWNKEKNQYEMDTDRFVVDEDFIVYYAPLNYYAEPFFHIEPHFYLNGERVA